MHNTYLIRIRIAMLSYLDEILPPNAAPRYVGAPLDSRQSTRRGAQVDLRVCRARVDERCGKTGDLLMMENPGPACLGCVGLDDLEFLPAGDALLSRRAKAKSKRCAVVVRFSRTRRRYKRQGPLVEPSALADTPGFSSIGQT